MLLLFVSGFVGFVGEVSSGGVTHAISIARHGRARAHLIRLSYVVAAYAFGETIQSRARCLVFDRNHGTWEGTGAVRGVSMTSIPECELGVTLDGNARIRVPHDGAGFVMPGDSGGRTLSLAFGDFDIPVLIRCTHNDGTLRPIVQKQETNSAGNGFHFAMQNGQLRGFARAGGVTLFNFGRDYPITDGLEHWVQLHADTANGIAKILIDGVPSGADEAFSGELDINGGDLIFGMFADLVPDSGFKGTLSLVGLAREGDPTISATLEQARQWEDITIDTRVESTPIVAEHGSQDPSPLMRAAGPGSLSLVLDNSPLNSAELQGLYTPGHVNALAGFEEGAPIKWVVTDNDEYSTEYVFFRGFISEIEPEPGLGREQRVSVLAETWLTQAMRWRVKQLPIQINIRSDNALRYVLDQCERPPFALDLAIGDNTFPLVFDDLDAQTAIYSEVARIALNEGGRLYERPDGTVVFESQTERYLKLTADAAWTQYELEELEARRAAASVINSMPTTITPVRIGPSTTDELASMSGRIEIPPGGTVAVELDYRDPDQPDAPIGGTDLTSPVATTDYTMFANEDGTGDDLTSFAEVSAPTADQGGSGAKLTIQNSHTLFSGWFLTRLRGRTLKRFDDQTFPFRDEESILARDLRETPLRLDYQTNAEAAESFVRQVLALRRAPFMAPRRATRRSVSPEIEIDILQRTIGDVVTLQESMTALAGTERSFIEGMQRIAGGDGTLVAVYALNRGPAAQSFMILDEPDFAELDDTTVLA